MFFNHDLVTYCLGPDCDKICDAKTRLTNLIYDESQVIPASFPSSYKDELCLSQQLAAEYAGLA
jgi:hypothetical protein